MKSVERGLRALESLWGQLHEKPVVIIHINPDWRIRSDPYNWIIEKRRKCGAKERWNAMGYYGDLDGAVLRLVQRRIRVMEWRSACLGVEVA